MRLKDVIIDIASGPFGSNLKVDCFVPDGFPIIDGANLTEYRLIMLQNLLQRKRQEVCLDQLPKGTMWLLQLAEH